MSLFHSWSLLFLAMLGMESRASYLLSKHWLCPSIPVSLHVQLDILLVGGRDSLYAGWGFHFLWKWALNTSPDVTYPEMTVPLGVSPAKLR